MVWALHRSHQKLVKMTECFSRVAGQLHQSGCDGVKLSLHDKFRKVAPFLHKYWQKTG